MIFYIPKSKSPTGMFPKFIFPIFPYVFNRFPLVSKMFNIVSSCFHVFLHVFPMLSTFFHNVSPMFPRFSPCFPNFSTFFPMFPLCFRVFPRFSPCFPQVELPVLRLETALTSVPLEERAGKLSGSFHRSFLWSNGYPLVNVHITMENHHFNGKTMENHHF